MNIDISKTKAYYHSISESSMCNCNYCRSYRLQVNYFQQSVKSGIQGGRIYEFKIDKRKLPV